ncbi:MAG: GNAT family N-acetyltransferase [Desulfobacterales bacterium]|nr:GNAT family N-acetyltransferase [Desulfobacterales bacterium]
MNIRFFTPGDAEFCFKTRSRAFIEKFYGELSPRAVSAGVHAYMPEDYIRMAAETPFFVVEENSRKAGFFTIQRKDESTSEIPLIYIDDQHLGKGLGKACIRFIEKWLASNWPEVERLIVDTVIPRYNGAFYQKAGFTPCEQVVCNFPGHAVKALRLRKKIPPK